MLFEPRKDWLISGLCFCLYKVRGIGVTLFLIKIKRSTIEVTASFGYVANSDGAGVADTLESNKSLILNPNQQVTAYWPLTGGLTSWINSNTTNTTVGKFQCATTTNAVGGGIVWSYKLDFYIMFKNTV